ncbi:hypothetical protein LUCX_114 [Xanthomonas phage vB_XciM_LucasX]|nr:hypothetical protein LUCX_114 [Xanthomonas phage vB_XciM_LucasX]
MRLLNLGGQDSQHSPLVIMAMGDLKDGEACYHYRASRDHGASMSVDGMEVVFDSSARDSDAEPNGVSIDCLLAICEDQAKQLSMDNPVHRVVAMQLLAARRALAVESQGRNMSPVPTLGEATNLSIPAAAPANVQTGGFNH